MFTIFVEAKAGYDCQYICSGLDALHLLVILLESNKNIKNYAIQEWGRDYSLGLFDSKKLLKFEDYLKLP